MTWLEISPDLKMVDIVENYFDLCSLNDEGQQKFFDRLKIIKLTSEKLEEMLNGRSFSQFLDIYKEEIISLFGESAEMEIFYRKSKDLDKENK